MENHGSDKRQPNEELDLGQLIEYIQKGIYSLFRTFLRAYLYIRKNAVKLLILVVVGLLIALGLNQIVIKQLKTEVIVKPNLDSKSYLYDVVAEIDANLKAKDTVFFNALNINSADLQGFKIEITPFEIEEVEDLAEEVKYLELLEKFKEEEGIMDVVRNEIMNKSVLNHRIVFFYKEAKSGRDIAIKLMDYINSNEYYKELSELYTQNAETRIKNNQTLIAQIDDVVGRYMLQMGAEEASSGTVVLSDEEQLNVPGLLRLKNELIQDTELKRLEIQGNKDAIRIVSLGGTQEVLKPLFAKFTIMIPAALVLLFMLWDLSKYLNRKANELEL